MKTDMEIIIEHLDRTIKDPIPRHILDKEILGKKTSDISKYQESKWYKQLIIEQMSNGSWGRFHTQNTKLKEKRIFKTTESALIRARELSLPKDDPVIKKAIKLMERYINGEEDWTDTNEHHYGFQITFKTLIAANIATFIPDHPLVIPKKEICAENLKKAFINGYLNEDIWESENRKSNEILLRPYMVYILWLLQQNSYLDEDTQRNYLNYIWNRKQGIYYRTNMASSDIQSLESKYFSTWLTGLENLKNFTLFPEFMKKKIFQHLINETYRLLHDDVCLPINPPVTNHYCESWKDKQSRKNDMILCILRVLIIC